MAGAVQDAENTERAEAVFAEQFDLVDANGRVAARLHATESGDKLLTFYDQNRVARMWVGMTPTGPTLSLNDANRKRNWISVRVASEDGSPSIMLRRSTVGTAEARFAITETGPSISLDRDDGAGVAVRVDQEGQSSLKVRARGREGSVVGLAAEERTPRVSLARKDGSSQTEVFLLPDGRPVASLSDDTGREVLVINLGKDGAPIPTRAPR
jgi:hypothetical protein